MPPVLTADLLVDREVPDDVHISPDGTEVIYKVGPRGRKGEHTLSSIWVATVGQEDSARQLTSGKHNDCDPRWSPDGKSIVFVSDRNDAGESTALYSLAMDRGEAIPLTDVGNKKSISKFEWSPDGSFIAFLSPDETTDRDEVRKKSKDDVQVWGTEWEYNRLRLLHVPTRQVSTLVERNMHVTQLAWSPDSKSIVYTLQQTPEADSGGYGVQFETISVADKKVNALVEFPGRLTDGLVWCDDRVFFLGGFSPKWTMSSAAVYEISLEKKTYSLRDHGETDDANALQLCNGLPYVKVLTGLYDKIRCLDNGPDLYEVPFGLATWDVYEKGGGKYIIVVGKGAVGNPTEIYSFELDLSHSSGGTDNGPNGSRIDPEKKYNSLHIRLSNHGHALRNPKLGVVKHLYCKSSDGEVDLDALLISPSPSKPMPTIVEIHGGPTYRYTETFSLDYYAWSPLLLQNNYAILMPNYRGGTSHGDSFVRYARGKMGTKEYEDIITIVEAGIKAGQIDKDRIIVGGWSQGGFLSYLSAVRNSPAKGWNFKGAICGAGVTDWDMMVMSSDAAVFEAELAGGSPWDKGRAKDDTSSRSGSAIWEMRGTDVPPILILHGEKDVRVPVSQAVAFQRACRHYGVPCEMAVYPREGHDVVERAHLVDMMKRVLRFVDSHIKV